VQNRRARRASPLRLAKRRTTWRPPRLAHRSP